MFYLSVKMCCAESNKDVLVTFQTWATQPLEIEFINELFKF